MDTGFPAIQDLTPQKVRAVVRRALRVGLDPELVGEFLATVDWGTFESADPGVREMLGQMEAWATGYSEGQLTREEYIARLRGLLPTSGSTQTRVIGNPARPVLTGRTATSPDYTRS